jgi:hypothetical protein
MFNFLIALLFIATAFLCIGVIGRGVEAGSGTLTLKIEGKVGPVPRLVFVFLSAVNYIAAMALFLSIVGASEPSPSLHPAGNNEKIASIKSAPNVTIQVSDFMDATYDYQETVTVNIDDSPPVNLHANAANNAYPEKDITLPEGRHAYQISVQGVTANGSQYSYSGQGTFLAYQGDTYTVIRNSNTGKAWLTPGA